MDAKTSKTLPLLWFSNSKINIWPIVDVGPRFRQHKAVFTNATKISKA